MMTQIEELKKRIETKQRQLQARLAELKADSGQHAREESHKLEAKLGELKTHLKSGWDNFSEDMAKRLNQWLKS